MRFLPTILAALSIALAPSMAAAQVQQPPPVIERIEPTSGPPGTTVQVIGRFFRPEQQVRIGTQPAEILTRLPNRWSIRVPQGATTGRITIDAPGGLTGIGPEFRVLAAAPAPAITDVQPRSSAPGAEVRILGESFSPRITENAVTLNGAPVVVRTATPTELRVIVPQGATSGRFAVRVTGAGEATAPVDLMIGAGLQIASFTPTVAAPGSRVTIAGSGFSPRARFNRVFVGSTPARVLAQGETSLTIEVPAGATSGPLMVEVRGGGRTYSSAPLVVQPAPAISGFSPPAGTPGAQVRIQGSGFGTDVRVVQVTIGGVAATVRGLTPTEVVAEIPRTAVDGPIAITVNGVGPVASAAPFDVLVAPAIADFQPRSGGVGTEVTITGTGFSPTASQDRVSLSGVACPVIAATPTELRVRIPQAASGPLTVEVENAGSARTSRPFVVTTPPVIARIEPESGTVASIFSIHGNSFGTNPALVEVTLADRRLEIRSLTDTRIDVLVPAGAQSGPVRVTVRLQGSVTASRPFTVLGGFTVTAIEPAAAYPGQPITIRGTGFAAQQMQVVFTGLGAPQPYAFFGPGEIRTWVPEGAQSGPVTVRSADGRSVTTPLTIGATPAGVAITSVEPQCLRAGCRVVVRGYGFARGRGRNQVTIGTSRVRVRSATPQSIEVELPRTPGTMTIRVDVRGVGSAESQPITITP